MSSSNRPSPTSREWRTTISGQEYLISTNNTNISPEFINNAFDSKDMYWAKRYPEQILGTLISNSLILGVYAVQPPFPPPKSADEPSSPETPSPSMEDPSFYFSSRFQGSGPPPEKLEQVGMARFVTDHVTVFYLTDVYIAPEHRGQGVGKWLIKCCREVVDSKPYMKRVMLMASPDEGKKFYEENLGLHDIQKEISQGNLVPMTKKGF